MYYWLTRKNNDIYVHALAPLSTCTIVFFFQFLLSRYLIATIIIINNIIFKTYAVFLFMYYYTLI